MKYVFCWAVFWVLLWSASPLFSAPSDLETAQRLLTEERITDAHQAVQDHLRHHPDDPHGLFLQGLILERLGRFTDAMNVYRDLIESHPELPEPYNNLAALLAAAGRFDEAKLTLQHALETHPSYATAHQNLGRIYSAMASSAYRRVLGKDDARMLVHLDPLEELSPPPAETLPPTATYVASVAPRGPESGTQSPPSFSSPQAAPEPAPEVALAAGPEPGFRPGSQSTAEPVAQAAPGPGSAPVPESAREPARESTSQPTSQPASRPASQPASEPLVEPVPEPVAPPPAVPEPRIIPEPEPVPAPTAPTPPTVAPPEPPAEAPAPRPSPDVVKAAITDMVLNWASAWASQNVDAYLSFYSGNFRPERGLALAQWREQRRSRVAAPPFIDVTLSNIVVTILEERAAEVRFDQRYRSNVINDEVPKELQLRKEDGQWRITRERLLPRS